MPERYGRRLAAGPPSDDTFTAMRAAAKRIERLSAAATASQTIRDAVAPAMRVRAGTRLMGLAAPNLQLGVLPAMQVLPRVQAFPMPSVTSMLPSLKGMFSLPVGLWREPATDLAHRVAHANAPDEIADIMQRLAATRVQPRLSGLRRKALKAWEHVLEVAREQSRRAVAALTGKRIGIDSRYTRASLHLIPPSQRRRGLAVVLPHAQVHYDINELLIRAPQFLGPSAEAEVRRSGETWWMTKTTPSRRPSTRPVRSGAMPQPALLAS